MTINFFRKFLLSVYILVFKNNKRRKQSYYKYKQFEFIQEATVNVLAHENLRPQDPHS